MWNGERFVFWDVQKLQKSKTQTLYINRGSPTTLLKVKKSKDANITLKIAVPILHIRNFHEITQLYCSIGVTQQKFKSLTKFCSHIRETSFYQPLAKNCEVKKRAERAKNFGNPSV